MEALVSHASHRGLEKGCAKPIVYVKSRGGGAWMKGIEVPCHPQGAKVSERCWVGLE